MRPSKSHGRGSRAERTRAFGRFRNTAVSLSDIYPHWVSRNQPEHIGAKSLSDLQRLADDLPILAVHLHTTSACPAGLVQAAVRSIPDQLLGAVRNDVSPQPCAAAARRSTENIVPPCFPIQAAGTAHVLRVTARLALTRLLPVVR